MKHFRRPRSAAAALLIAAVAAPWSAGLAQVSTTRDCAGPVGDPEPSTQEWQDREQANWSCSQQGSQDQDTNPAARFAYAEMRADPGSVLHQGLSNLEVDPLRYPPLRWDGLRGRWLFLEFTAPYGDADGPAAIGSGVVPDPVAPTKIGAQLFAPLEACAEPEECAALATCSERRACLESAVTDCPDGVPLHPAGPYPIVVLQGGSMGDSNEMQWLAEQLAEHGYVVMTSNYFNSASGWVETVRAMIDFMVSTPESPSPSGEINPFWEITDREHVGMGGYSKWSGGSEVTSADPRIDAFVYQGAVAASERAPDSTAPGLFFGEEYFGGGPMRSPPSHGKWDVASVANAAVDTMQVSLRAATHYEFATLQTGGKTLFPRSRYGQQLQGYYALAWFDRYLRGAREECIAEDATARLIARALDDSIDQTSIGTGTFDAEKALAAGNMVAGNVPIRIAGLRVVDLLSFYFPSAYSLDGGALQCLDMRDGCGLEDPPPPAPPEETSVVAGAVLAAPGSSLAGYATPTMVSLAGARATFVNLDPTGAHDVTSAGRDAEGNRLFRSRLIAHGGTAGVDGTEYLPAGSYRFFCSTHPGMQGTLEIVDVPNP